MGCIMPVQVQSWVLPSLNILVFCASWIFYYFSWFLGFPVLRAALIISVLWVRTARVTEVKNMPEVPWLKAQEPGYSRGPGTQAGDSVWFASGDGGVLRIVPLFQVRKEVEEDPQV